MLHEIIPMGGVNLAQLLFVFILKLPCPIASTNCCNWIHMVPFGISNLRKELFRAQLFLRRIQRTTKSV